ncbi:MAG: helix-hairpin-helix domain-containing protein [Planctomycetaceae bacterium]|jgi:hypothetical protein|nr:helix-hairpin-helix domain-containing protein [Planctomycetaceae bacterium]
MNGNGEFIRLREQDTLVCITLILLVPLCCAVWNKQDMPPAQSYRYEIDPNNATSAEWQTLPGIGPKLAEAISGYQTRTPFTDTHELQNVKGIGVKKYNTMKPFLRKIKAASAD